MDCDTVQESPGEVKDDTRDDPDDSSRTENGPDVADIKEQGDEPMEVEENREMETDAGTSAADEKKTLGEPDSEVIGEPDSEVIGEPDSEVIGEPDSQVLGQPDNEVNLQKVSDGSNDNVDESVNEKVNSGKQAESIDSSSVHSNESEKENVNSAMPMDLSAPMDLSNKLAVSNKDLDSLTLSDESDEDMNRMTGDSIYPISDIKNKRKMIKRLQADLRNEEAKLVLLKKLRQSQMAHPGADGEAGKSQQLQRQQQSVQPPPLIRGGAQQQIPTKPAHSQPPLLARGNQSPVNQNNQGKGPPPLVMAPRNDQQRQMLQNQQRQMLQQQQQQQRPGLSLSNVPSGFRGSQAQALQQQIQQQQQSQQPQPPRVPEETPAQRQAAAKLALRKQLEKTLLQIPPPKPPPPEMNFIPSLASPDFIYLLGLEEAVNFIIDTNLITKGKKNAEEKLVCNPFTCIQCGTDFTPVWKREKPGSKCVICECCVTSNQKKALKQEHTNRLKSAFVKALQQEQEIERMQSQEAKSAPTPPKDKDVKVQEKEARDAGGSGSRGASSNYKENIADALRQHQNLLQAHQAASLRMGQQLGLQGFNPRSPFQYQIPFTARHSDLQRQYLLDMIPKAGLPWNN